MPCVVEGWVPVDAEVEACVPSDVDGGLLAEAYADIHGHIRAAATIDLFDAGSAAMDTYVANVIPADYGPGL